MATRSAGGRTHHIYLIPGFFGFANLGRFRYFAHVLEFLGQRAPGRGRRLRLHVVRTMPTAALPRRAARLAEIVAATVAPGDTASLVGHSTGGLDARLFLSPRVDLPTSVDVESVARRVKSVVTVATPHHGAPLATVLTGIRGQRLLALLSVSSVYVIRFGHLPLRAFLSLTRLLSAADLRREKATLGDALFHQLLARFSARRRNAVERLLVEVSRDQSLLTQLTPEGMTLFNATVRNRPGVRYGCVISQAHPPGLLSTVATGLDAAAQSAHTLYHALHRYAGATDPHFAEPGTVERAFLRKAYRRIPRPSDNDGIVPTRSQVWSEILAAVHADHLDLIGHFASPASDPPHFDWLTTGTGFSHADFEQLWDTIARFLRV